jgi:hypothetical protein
LFTHANRTGYSQDGEYEEDENHDEYKAIHAANLERLLRVSKEGALAGVEAIGAGTSRLKAKKCVRLDTYWNLYRLCTATKSKFG